ncbi:MAG TPA: PLP-dependent aminotransferase family protein [Pyrinomonadaceae bacterium]
MSTQATTLSPGIALADWAMQTSPSALQQMLAAATGNDVISFALGLPAQELFPVGAYGNAVAQVLANEKHALQYSPPLRPLKSQIVKLMAMRGVSCREEQIFVTAGAQQGLSLLSRLLLNPGGQLVTEELTYTGFQQAIEPFQPNVITVPTNASSGIDLLALESVLKREERPAFIFTMTEGHNPLGVSLREEDRRRLAELARCYQVPVVEDDAYGFLRYDEAGPPPMRAFDEDWIFYVGSFSKILAPSLRVGWLIVPEPLIPVLSVIKEASDIDTATFTQRTVVAYLEAGHLPDHIKELRLAYRERRDCMIEALSEHFPSGARWNKPDSGVFVWVDLNAVVDTTEILRRAIETQRVAYIPGQAFAVNGRACSQSCLRLNFSHCPPELIKEGIARLGHVLKQSVGQSH